MPFCNPACRNTRSTKPIQSSPGSAGNDSAYGSGRAEPRHRLTRALQVQSGCAHCRPARSRRSHCDLNLHRPGRGQRGSGGGNRGTLRGADDCRAVQPACQVGARPGIEPQRHLGLQHQQGTDRRLGGHRLGRCRLGGRRLGGRRLGGRRLGGHRPDGQAAQRHHRDQTVAAALDFQRHARAPCRWRQDPVPIAQHAAARAARRGTIHHPRPDLLRRLGPHSRPRQRSQQRRHNDKARRHATHAPVPPGRRCACRNPPLPCHADICDRGRHE